MDDNLCYQISFDREMVCRLLKISFVWVGMQTPAWSETKTASCTPQPHQQFFWKIFHRNSGILYYKWVCQFDSSCNCAWKYKLISLSMKKHRSSRHQRNILDTLRTIFSMAKTLCLIRRSQNKTSKQHLWLKMAALRIRLFRL